MRTQIFMIDISQWEKVANVQTYFFEDIIPAFTILEVSKLIDPNLLIKIEVTAIRGEL